MSRPAPSPQSTTSGDAPDNTRLPEDPPCLPFGAKEIGSFNKLGKRFWLDMSYETANASNFRPCPCWASYQ